MQIEIQESAKKDILKIDFQQRRKIISSIFSLEKFPNVQNVKKLINFSPRYRLRIGDYRVLFEVKEERIIIARIKHRKEAY